MLQSHAGRVRSAGPGKPDADIPDPYAHHELRAQHPIRAAGQVCTGWHRAVISSPRPIGPSPDRRPLRSRPSLWPWLFAPCLSHNVTLACAGMQVVSEQHGRRYPQRVHGGGHVRHPRATKNGDRKGLPGRRPEGTLTVIGWTISSPKNLTFAPDMMQSPAGRLLLR